MAMVVVPLPEHWLAAWRLACWPLKLPGHAIVSVSAGGSAVAAGVMTMATEFVVQGVANAIASVTKTHSKNS